MSASDIVIIGTLGMLGREVQAACRRRGAAARPFSGPDELDITCHSMVRRALGDLRPAVVINASGYTDVDAAESEPEVAHQINGVAVGNLAAVCEELGAVLVHYSTDYVFNGRARRPYRVDDTPDPINAYGRSKLAGEQAVLVNCGQHLIVRTSWMFARHGRNFVRTVFDLAQGRSTLDVVNDQHGRPTFAADLAEMTLDLLDQGSRGTVHVANAGQCSWFELAEAVVKLAGFPCEVRPCPTSAHPRPAKRPPYSVLELSETTAMLGEQRHWKDAVAECVEQLLAHSVSQTDSGSGCRATT